MGHYTQLVSRNVNAFSETRQNPRTHAHVLEKPGKRLTKQDADLLLINEFGLFAISHKRKLDMRTYLHSAHNQ